uniref:Uncharacterized protein n=1 Tax=Rhizophora mucronata TaxID=61149 RepID=A0A2P2J743_RHIMU
MMYNARSVVLEAFQRVKLVVNKRKASCFMCLFLPEDSIMNSTRNKVRIQGCNITANLEIPCYPRDPN